jgi:hypothetical protein
MNGEEKTMKTLFFATLLIVFACLPATAEVVSTTFPVSLIVDPATCPLVPPNTGIISGSGELTITVRSHESGNGGVHFGIHVNGHGTATDEGGNTWVWSDADIFEPGSVNSNGDNSEATIVESFHLVGKGKRIMIQGVFHITIVNGTPIVTFEKGNATEENEACEGFIF